MKQIDNLTKRINEIKKSKLEKECKLLKISTDKNKKKNFIEKLIKQFESIIKEYKKINSKSKHDFKDISNLILLNISIEGLIKIVTFDKLPLDYLQIDKKNRTIYNIKNLLLKIIPKKEQNKINIVKIILDLVNEQRNTFIHFPLYYEDDYRFKYYYFQLIAYLIEYNDYWNYLDNDIKKYIKIQAKELPTGIKLLKKELY